MTDRTQLDEEATKRDIERLAPRYRFKPGASSIIGTGGFGSVVLAEDTLGRLGRGESRDVAIKVVCEDVLRHAGRRIVNELMLLRQIRHDNIVALLDVFTNAPPEAPTNFTTVYLVFEWVQHDLRGIIYHRPRILHPNHVSWIMYQLFLALHLMHSCGVAHRDITPTNILVNPQGTEVKVIDLGLSRVASGDPTKMTSYVTQRWYRAPEVVMSIGHDTQLDMWSAGTVLAEMIRNEPLFRLNTSRGSSDSQARSLRTQQLVRLLVVIGPPDDIDIDLVRNESVQVWLRIYRDKVLRRTAVVETVARSVIEAGEHFHGCIPIASCDDGIRKAREQLGSVSGSMPNAPETRKRVKDALAILHNLRTTYGESERERLGDPKDDICKILPHFTGAKSFLRQELPRDVDPRCLDLLNKLLQITARRRPSAEEALQHPYVVEWYDADDLARVAPREVVDSYTAAAAQTGLHYDWREGLAAEVKRCQDVMRKGSPLPPGTLSPANPPVTAAPPSGRMQQGTAGVPRAPPGHHTGMECDDDGEDYGDDELVADAGGLVD